MEKTKKHIKVVNKSPHPTPVYAKYGDSGFDLRAWISDDDPKNLNSFSNGVLKNYITLQPFERSLIHTGLYFDVPEECEIQVRPRSGQALKKGITVLNTPGTVDETYTGECCIILINLTKSIVTIEDGERIAQAVLCPVYNNTGIVEVEEVEEITKQTDRGSGGFGHTGIS